MKKGFAFILTLSLGLIMITGCQSNAIEGESSNATLLKIHNEVFTGQAIVTGNKFRISDLSGALIEHTNVKDKEVSIGEKIGTVKVKADKYPVKNLTSNYFEKGTEIYKVNGNEDILLAKTGPSEYLSLLGDYDKEAYD